MSSLTPSYPLQKGELGEGLPVAVAVRTPPLSCEPAWDLHSAPHLLGHLPGPLHSQMPGGVPRFLHVQKQGIQFQCLRHTSSSPSMVTPPAPCHREEETRPEQIGGSCPEAPEYLGSMGPGAGLCPPVPLSTPGTLQGDGGLHSEEDTDMRAAGLAGCWLEPDPGKSPWLLPAEQRPTRPALN